MKTTNSRIFKIIAFFICFLLVFEQSGFAQVVTQLDIAGHLGAMRNALTVDKFRPLHLRYLQYLPQNNNFRLLLDKGNLDPSTKELENTSKDLLKYFLIGLTLPNDTFWVNLRPDSPDNIIDDQLARTDIGRIMLEADVQLKRDTAQATSPETPEGKVYWDKLYQKAGELFGNQNVTIPTLTRPWIVPDEIIIRETLDSAYIYKATLKVMLEQDYLKGSAVYNFEDDRLKGLNEYSSQLIRELIIPKLIKEVNTSKKYAALRQVYYSLILASWFKARNQGKDNQYARLIDRKDLTGLISKESWSRDTFFTAYQKSFKDGEYNIQEPAYNPYGQTIRSYFSGGISDLCGGAGLQQAFAGQGQSADGRNAVMSGRGLPASGPALSMIDVDKDNVPRVVSGADVDNAGSPDMAKKKISHAERNSELAGQIEQLAVIRITRSGDVTVEGDNTQAPASYVTGLTERLGKISGPGGAIERAAGDLEIEKLAARMGMRESQVRQVLIRIAQDTDILLVRGRLTLHVRGPFGHARRGVSGRGKAIWVGEKLFSHGEITDEDIALLLLEEAKHILAPYADHDVVIHSRALFKKLSAAAVALGEPVGQDICEADALPVPGNKVFYLPEILAQRLDFTAVQDYKNGAAAAAIRPVFEYLNSMYADVAAYAKDGLKRLGGEEIETQPSEEEKGLSSDSRQLAQRINSMQRQLWDALAKLPQQIRMELFGTTEPGSFSQEAFDRLFLFSLPRYFASIGIFSAIEHFPIMQDDIVVCNLYAMDLYEIDRVEDPSARWHRGLPVTCKKLTLGQRVSIDGHTINTPVAGGFSGRSSFGVIVIKAEDIERVYRLFKQQMQSSSFAAIAGVPLAMLLDVVNSGKMNALVVNSAMLGVAGSRYVRATSDAQLRQECLQIVEHHEMEHLIRTQQGQYVFIVPENVTSAQQFIEAYNVYCFHEELSARLAELLHMPPLQTLLILNDDIRSGTKGTGAWYGSASHYIFEKIVEIVRQDPGRYGFKIVQGYPIEPQIQLQIFTLVTNSSAFMEIMTRIDQMHDEELRHLGASQGSPDMDSAEAGQLEDSTFELVKSRGQSAVDFSSTRTTIPCDQEILNRIPQNPRKKMLFVKADTYRAGLVAVLIGRHLDELTDKEAYEALTRIIAMDSLDFQASATPIIGDSCAHSLQSYAMDLLSEVYEEDALSVLLGYIERAHDLEEFSHKYLLDYAIICLPVEFIAANPALCRQVLALIDEKAKLLGGPSYRMKECIEKINKARGPQEKRSLLGSIGAAIGGLVKGAPVANNSAGLESAQPAGSALVVSLNEEWRRHQEQQIAARARFSQRRTITLREVEEALSSLKALDLFLDWYDRASREAGNYDLLSDGQSIPGRGGLSSRMSREHNFTVHFQAAIRDLFDEIFCARTHRGEPIDSLINPNTVSNARKLMRTLVARGGFFSIVDTERVDSEISDGSSLSGLKSSSARSDTVNMHERAKRMVANSVRAHVIHQISDATDERYNHGWLSKDGLYIDEETYALIRGHLKVLAAELEKVYGPTGAQFFEPALAPALRAFGIDTVSSADAFGLDPEAAKVLALRRMPFNQGGGGDVNLGVGDENGNAVVYYGRVGRQTDGPFFVSEPRFDSAHKVVVTPDGRTPDIKSFRPSDPDTMLSPDLAGETLLRQALDSSNPEAVLRQLISDGKPANLLPISNAEKEELRQKARAALADLVPGSDLEALVENLLDAIVRAHLVGQGKQGVYTDREIAEKAQILADRMDELGFNKDKDKEKEKKKKELVRNIRRALMEAGVAGFWERFKKAPKEPAAAAEQARPGETAGVKNESQKAVINTSVTEAVVRAIMNSNDERITFADYMRTCLYHENGGYASGSVRPGAPDITGRNVGYFATHPEQTSPHYGRAVAYQLFGLWKQMGNPKIFTVVEMGAGNGTLMRDVLRCVYEEFGGDFSISLRPKIVEISPDAIHRQKTGALKDYASLVEWIPDSALDFSAGEIEGVIISNELPDAFPVHRVRIGENGKLQEAYVGLSRATGNFIELWDKPSRPEIEEYVKTVCALEGVGSLEEGLEFPVNLDAVKWMKNIARNLKRGYVITIDYSVSPDGTLKSRNKNIPHIRSYPRRDLRDVYQDTGKRDITADIYFPMLIHTGEQVGLNKADFISELQFLSRSGVFDESALGPVSNSYFRVLVQSKGMESGNRTHESYIGPSLHSGLTPPASGAAGGIDFRSLPIVTQAIGNLRMNMDIQAINRMRGIDVSRELGDIQRMVNAGISPSGERIKEYVQASSVQGNLDIDKVISCISDILRLEEERCCATESQLRDILVVLESARSSQELKEIFVGKI